VTRPAGPASPASGQPGALSGAGFPGVTAPALSAVPVAADGSPVSGDAAGDGQLAHTGSTVVRPLVTGLLALALGLGLTVASRRRTTVLS
jgi:hypothetical protein